VGVPLALATMTPTNRLRLVCALVVPALLACTSSPRAVEPLGPRAEPVAGPEPTATAVTTTAVPDPGASIEHASVFFVGHSLVGADMPQMVGTFARARGKKYQAHGQLGWGTALREHWAWDGKLNGDAPAGFDGDNRAPFFAGEAKKQLSTGKYDVLIMAESNGLLIRHRHCASGAVAKSLVHALLSSLTR